MPSMGMPLPAVQHDYRKAIYGEIVVFYEIAVHFSRFKLVVYGRGKPLPYAHNALFLRKIIILQRALFHTCIVSKNSV